MGLLASESGWAQEPVVISVHKRPSESTTVQDEVTGEQSGFRWFGMWVPSGNSSGFQGFRGDLIPSVKTEYDLFTKRNLSFYSCGLDIGTEQLMLGLNLKFPQENGKLTSLEHMRGNLSISRRWHFKRVNMSKYNMYQPKTAFIQYGVSFDHRIGGYGEATDQSTPVEKVQFFNGKFSVNHPISGNLLIGAELVSHFSVRSSQSSYASAGISLSYFISTLD